MHRDIKPGNIMLTKDGSKLLDFGLAKLKQQAGAVGVLPLSQMPTLRPGEKPAGTPTIEGTIIGTVRYMSPEQVEGRNDDIDARSDIFSFGATVYEMLTGRKAFEGKSQASVMSKIMQVDPPVISSFDPPGKALPEAMDCVAKTCLAKDPDERWQTATDLCRELKRIRDGGSQGGIVHDAELAALASARAVEQAASEAAVVRGRKQARLAWGVAAALLIGMLTMLAVRQGQNGGMYGGEAGAGASLRFTLPPPENTNFISFPSTPYHALSPDGRTLALVAIGRPSNQSGGTIAAGTTGIWIHSFDSLSDRMLPGTESPSNLTTPFWSPDGRFVGFFADGKLKRSDIAGGPPLVLCDAPVVTATVGGTWNQDGVILFGAPGGIFQVSASGGEPKPVTKVNEARGETSHAVPHFLPDGRHFLYVVRSGKPEVTGVYVGQLDSPGAPGAGGEPERLVATNNKAEYAAGHLLFLRGRTLLAQPFEAASLKLNGEPVPLADPVGIDQVGSRAAYSVAANGTLVFGPGGVGQSTQLHWFDRSGKPLEAPGPAGPYVDPELAPDGWRVAVERSGQQTTVGDLWLLETGRDVATQFTFDPSSDNYAIWSPDGQQITFRSARSGVPDLYRKAASGVAGEEPLLQSPVLTDWSADGRYLVYGQDAAGGNDLWVLPLEGAGASMKPGKPFPFLQSNFNEDHAQFFPDGKWLAYTSNESGRYEVYVQSFPQAGGKYQVSTGGGIAPRWRRDGPNNGKELYYIAPDAKLMAVAIRGESTLEAGLLSAAAALFQTNIYEAGGYVQSDKHQYDVSADGQRFLINTPVEGGTSAPLTVVTNFTAVLKK